MGGWHRVPFTRKVVRYSVNTMDFANFTRKVTRKSS
jgi:hypothetical protein